MLGQTLMHSEGNNGVVSEIKKISRLFFEVKFLQWLTSVHFKNENVRGAVSGSVGMTNESNY